MVETPMAQPTELPVGALVRNPAQPRRRFNDESLAELAASIKELGLVQPIVVRPLEGGKYEIVAGERRWRASQLAGLGVVPVMVKASSAQVALEIAVVENVQREDITPIECAMAYRRLADEFGLGQEEIAKKVGKSRVSISNTLRLLRLPQAIQDAIGDGLVTEGHARALLMVESPLRQDALFRKVVAEGLSVRETERQARGGTEARPPGEARPPKSRLDMQWHALGESISEYFGAPSKLSKTGNGGRLTVEFFSDDELQGILDKLGIG